MSEPDVDPKALESAAKGYRKAAAERGYIARKMFVRVKKGDGNWGALLAAGEETLVGLISMQAFNAGYKLAMRHVTEKLSGIDDYAAQTRGTYTSRELDAMSREEA
jgi:hypothetical protein